MFAYLEYVHYIKINDSCRIALRYLLVLLRNSVARLAAGM